VEGLGVGGGGQEEDGQMDSWKVHRVRLAVLWGRVGVVGVVLWKKGRKDQVGGGLWVERNRRSFDFAALRSG